MWSLFVRLFMKILWNCDVIDMVSAIMISGFGSIFFHIKNALTKLVYWTNYSIHNLLISMLVLTRTINSEHLIIYVSEYGLQPFTYYSYLMMCYYWVVNKCSWYDMITVQMICFECESESDNWVCLQLSKSILSALFQLGELLL